MRLIKTTKTLAVPEGGQSTRQQRKPHERLHRQQQQQQHSIVEQHSTASSLEASIATQHAISIISTSDNRPPRLHCRLCSNCYCCSVTVAIKSRSVKVTGPRGTLSRHFGHLSIDLILEAGGRKIRAELWHGDRKSIACIRTCITHIKNMITGTTKGEYRTAAATEPMFVQFCCATRDLRVCVLIERACSVKRRHQVLRLHCCSDRHCIVTMRCITTVRLLESNAVLLLCCTPAAASQCNAILAAATVSLTRQCVVIRIDSAQSACAATENRARQQRHVNALL